MQMADDKRDGGWRKSPLPLHSCGSGIIFLAPPPHVGHPPAICKVGVYVPSAHPMYDG